MSVGCVCDCSTLETFARAATSSCVVDAVLSKSCDKQSRKKIMNSLLHEVTYLFIVIPKENARLRRLRISSDCLTKG